MEAIKTTKFLTLSETPMTPDPFFFSIQKFDPHNEYRPRHLSLLKLGQFYTESLKVKNQFLTEFLEAKPPYT